MDKLFEILRFAAVLAAAALLGNWFMTEVRKSRARNEPRYKPYLTLPGVLVILAVLLPIVYWLIIRINP
ncbi:hypothetical protein [Desulfococcus multivorans]|jgi:uncharacterized membrane protein YphA (DoxX/SURF4 family)|uniref:Uncharacterized protein n=1 Tax=Desulfococcus multivorans DSM 2059 TaxID=1121405 RepID=S7TQ55_DESML|nr:hypothetical protein [Desulfococcus multivorans]AOY58992.1 uncharacterized protein Dmul_22200 [Desulfococcus multivorans]AQV01256.1 hypothetical protein B2D07_11085 [Desulfococcus multivorans]EPR39101.1 hypothetical protein dsmv_2757 [Desulfococcus multivorans DSM 2059]MDX9819631.1 hypothetical protein [Desulfococcus multivorans]SJZ54981.1 hypothetical protein SAMN02745446_00918 [Desulfococcus multivorans DSM 2059]